MNSEQHTVSSEQQTMSSEQQTMSSEQQTMSSEQHTMSSEQHTMSSILCRDPGAKACCYYLHCANFHYPVVPDPKGRSH